MSVYRRALSAFFVWSVAGLVQAGPFQPFISEIHYDNAGVDRGEFIAVTAPGGTDLAGWQLVLYNGSNGAPYQTLDLSGSVPGGEVWGEIARSAAGMQNGDDAIALVSPARALVDFIAYEGAFDAVAGIAAGQYPRLTPEYEGPGTAEGMSLQRVGGLGDWDWTVDTASRGTVNPGLIAPVTAAQTVPSPPVAWLWAVVLFGWWLRRVRPGTVGMRRQPALRCLGG